MCSCPALLFAPAAPACPSADEDDCQIGRLLRRAVSRDRFFDAFKTIELKLRLIPLYHVFNALLAGIAWPSAGGKRAEHIAWRLRRARRTSPLACGVRPVEDPRLFPMIHNSGYEHQHREYALRGVVYSACIRSIESVHLASRVRVYVYRNSSRECTIRQ